MLVKLIRRTGYVIATVIILAALVVSIARLFTPYLNEHLPNFEEWSSQALHVPVKIEHVQISWNFYEPELTFKNVKILDKDTQQPKVAIRQIGVNLSIWHSLLSWQLLPETIKISGVHLTVHHPLQGQPIIEELKDFAITDNSTGKPSSANEIIGWIFSQPNLILQDIDISYQSENAAEKSFVLNELVLTNNELDHQLKGDVVLRQEFSTRAKVRLNWVGNVTDLQHVSAELYVYLEGVSLPQWLQQKSWHNISVKQGLGSAKIWATWDKNQWQEMQTQFQFYNLELALATKSLTQEIPRLSGHLGWKREGNKQIVAGDDILLDLADHLWPTTHFTLSMIPLGTSYKVESLKIGYLDLADTHKLAIESGLLDKAQQELLTAIDPKGDIRNLEVTSATGSITDIASLAVAAQFENLTFAPWQKFPGITHASGVLTWQEKQGNLTLNSHKIKILPNTLFTNPLSFDQLTGVLTWQKSPANILQVTVKNLQANNIDLKMQTDISLSIPANDSPSIDLLANFSLKNAATISDYLPLKILDADLAKWLKHAFFKGEIDAGKAIVKGKLADFPFEKNNGTFSVTTELSELDFNYAPNWPMMRHLKGKLSFVGSAMNVDIDSAQILNIPLTAVHAVIPYIGPNEKQVLHVQSLIKSDFSQALDFIQRSPLRDTVGKDLAGLQLTGPMQLNLGLIIPLKNPGSANVSGDVTFAESNLSLPEWRLIIDKLQGSFHFSENDLSATQLQGQLFDEPIHLSLTTEHEKDKPSYVKANLSGTLQIISLENFLKIPLTQYAQGATTYQAELRLMSHKESRPTHISINTDLKGVALNLPDPYGKKADEVRNLTLDITLNRDRPMLAQIQYDKTVSAALNVQESDQHLHFVGGELRLGGGTAVAPKESGLVITADFKELNWTMLQPYLDWSAKNNKSKSVITQMGDGLFRSVNLNADTVDLVGQQLTKARIQLARTGNNWVITINSTQAIGKITLPANFSRVDADFQRLHLVANNKQNMLINPKTLPVLSISASDVSVGEKKLGRVQLETVPAGTGLQIKQLQINSAATNLRASGSWQLVGKQYTSRLQGQLSTTVLNQMLSQWGVDSSGVVGSWANSNFDLTWPDAPYNPSLAGLSGKLSLKLGAGRIVNLSQSTEAKIGIGRMFSIFSLQTIPRRLSLDFSDLFQNGYNFDSVVGNFILKSGNAFTNDTRFDGPVARIDIGGRIGLGEKDYDLKLGVTTYVATSLLPAAIGAVFPPAGVATLVASVLVTQAASKMATYQYHITGTWANPNWQQISFYRVP